MKKITKEMILNKAKELNIKFMRLRFTDILGMPKNVEIPVRELEKALDGEIMFDGSSIQGFVRIEESDMYLKPDYSTFTVNPWEEEKDVARIICDVYNPDGLPFNGCPRNNLKRVLKEVEEMGYSTNLGPEMEFFHFLGIKKVRRLQKLMIKVDISIFYPSIWGKKREGIW